MYPDEYLSRMKELLNGEYDEYLRSLETTAYKALRLNPLKAEEAQLLVLLNKMIPGTEKPAADGNAGDSLIKPGQVEWEPLGYYYSDDRADGDTDAGYGLRIMQPGKSPLHEAGLYYIQEPSAMLPVAMLMGDTDVIAASPGGSDSGKDACEKRCERILDLCAAPGGKSTQIASYMRGRGVLICNEIVPPRAGILSENIERMGVRNALVLNETPQKLKDCFIDYFDRILVDAPCSGEGMFRKNEQAAEEWSTDNVRMSAERQDEILDCAASMLKPGGILVYSTCTFSREEDEECIERFLERHSDYMLKEQYKLFPHRIKGEGHFAAKLVRMAAGYPEDKGNAENCEESAASEDKEFAEDGGEAGIIKGASGYCVCGSYEGISIAEYLEGDSKGNGKSKEVRSGREEKSGKRKPGKKDAGAKETVGKEVGQREFKEFCKAVLTEDAVKRLKGRLLWFGDNLYLMPEGAPGTDGLRVKRPGLQLGTFKKDRFEPSHALALAMRPEEAAKTVDITLEEAADYILGMTLNCGQDDMRGWVLVCCEGISLGWGKAVGNVIKNHYPKGLRKQL
jgi:16S rRNA C967 or C1407 C5-methylase (RsmB/RsmF family)/NOL1/NOP2/fmu family ribosome biogenesis protein